MNKRSELIGKAITLQVDRLDHYDLNEQADFLPKTRFDLGEMEATLDHELKTVWSFMTPNEHPRFSLAMLRDLKAWQSEIQRLYLSEGADIQYVVLGSRYPGAFNLGGDLDHVATAIEQGNKAALEDYGNRCVDILYRNFMGLDLPVVTIALIQGDAVGGGFESALSFNVLVAERGATFSLPENLFGMFPGVGAHALLTRRLNAAMAERLMMSGKSYTAEDMYEFGLVHVLAEPGEGEATVRHYIKQNAKRQNSHLGIYRAAREVNPLTLEELRRIVHIWAETGMRLSPMQLKAMHRLAGLQSRS
jgi:DSF synthase